ncbi:IS66 family insertion sequence element accessory protein TnpA [Flavobacterium sp. XS2P39]|uniref:IS66 family insertion sequence element accessory protein TnpA n=1 Tax=Flavobacterium sp. XS2P39 TaxID=3401725 RepID=UPI003AAD5117
MERKEHMLSQVESWRQSGIREHAFCDKAGIKLSTFSYWVRISKKQYDLAGGFIELTNPSVNLGNQYKIVHPNEGIVPTIAAIHRF